MNPTDPTPTPQLDAPAPRRPVRTFRKSVPAPDKSMVNRQMTAAALAYRAFGSMEQARRFMNEPDERLGGRPMDVAGATEDGCRAVMALIEQDAATAAA